MQLEVLGVGNAFTSRRHNTSFLIRSGRNFLVDGPQGLFAIFRKRHIDPADIDDVIVTHVHGDHTSGLETFFLWKKYVQRKRFRLYTSNQVLQELKTRFLPGFSQTFTADSLSVIETTLEDYADFVELVPNCRTVLADDLDLDVRLNWHPTPTLGLKFSCAHGSVGISGDTCYRRDLLETLRDRHLIDPDRFRQLAGDWLWECDVIYHEAARKEPTTHTLEKDLLGLSDDVRTKIRLVHISDEFQEREIPLAREGELLNLGASGPQFLLPEDGSPRYQSTATPLTLLAKSRSEG